MKKLLIISVLLIITIITCTACDNYGKQKLDTPMNVHYEGSKLVWDEVENADEYVIDMTKGTGGYSYVVYDNMEDILITTPGDYSVTVVARDSSGNYLDSQPSEPVIYHMGIGTEEDPFLIFSYDDLMEIGTGTTLNEEDEVIPLYYTLSCDIDLEGEEWTPIGGRDGFKGYFEGQGYTISNYSITNKTSSLNYYGLFSRIDKGLVRNLNVQDYTIDISSNGSFRIGGLVGYVSDSSRIENCNVLGDISMEAPSWDATSSVDTSTQYIGQMIGYLGQSGDKFSTVIGCSADGNLSVEGYTVYTGGLLGYSYSSKIIQSSSNGVVSATGKTLFVGGLAGSSQYTGSHILNCYSRTDVISNSDYNTKIGSLAGYITNNSSVEYSYATGSIDSVTSSTFQSGFIGEATGTLTLLSLYYDHETMGIGNPKDTGNNASRDNIYSRTTVEMKNGGTYQGYDFDNIWTIDSAINEGYPTLREYIPETDEDDE